MDSIIADYLSGLKFGELQTFKNMDILPLFTSANGDPQYVSLKEALGARFITITEVNQSGSVPELKVRNTSSQHILLLDGEELVGAKQNRVLNTSILLKGNSELIIPVSCTEQGRWGYTSPMFSHSEVMMSYRSRALKAHTVSESLHTSQKYSSDQLEVWSAIERMHSEAGTSSGTRAMRDVYVAKTKELEEYEQVFEYIPQQRGSLIFINGEVAGFDIISRDAAYKTIHSQLVRSYAMDALLQMTSETASGSLDKAKSFLEKTAQCQESRFESPGEGYDYRFESAEVIGSGLVANNRVIHLAFFKMDKEATQVRMSGYMQRRRFRQRGTS
jgi:hypothetical protein